MISLIVVRERFLRKLLEVSFFCCVVLCCVLFCCVVLCFIVLCCVLLIRNDLINRCQREISEEITRGFFFLFLFIFFVLFCCVMLFC